MAKVGFLRVTDVLDDLNTKPLHSTTFKRMHDIILNVPIAANSNADKSVLRNKSNYEGNV